MEEFPDLILQPVAVGRQHLGGGKHLRGGRAGLGRTCWVPWAACSTFRETQEVGLAGNGVDQLNEITDGRRRNRELADAPRRGAGWVTASPAIRADSCTSRLISLTEEDSSSVAVATHCTLLVASPTRTETEVSSCARGAVVARVEEDASSSVDAEPTISMISRTARSKPSARLTMSRLR